VYDHASVPATLEQNFFMSPLTQRDARANNVLHLLSLTTARTDCPTTLNNPASSSAFPAAASQPEDAVSPAAAANQPLPTSGNLPGFLATAVKADLDMAGKDPLAIAQVQQKVAALKTTGQANAYMDEVMAKANARRAAQ